MNCELDVKFPKQTQKLTEPNSYYYIIVVMLFKYLKLFFVIVHGV